ncbi:HAMP domain-containing sensor histidine kinase [Roseofilum sp. BLCC_M91]|uniref:histidine kinase n=1 Tax=Roseofilum halophilum BLCC-M91 TaxID=3022259 RepID=A0ABT7BEZ5_9CYAN|nr:HAMP domain-containing sensor histidine kinase [Roseofilum halophilum]MDJ1177753.1 HAMP domain-containing sensor histidine kinase [Roseofilum halophilum BLCC-M91]
MNSPLLQAFTAPVVVCVQTTLLENALMEWSLTDQALLVVIDPAQFPIACIQFSRWLPYWLKPGSQGVQASSLLKINPQLYQIGEPILEPIACFSSDLEMDELQEQLKECNPGIIRHYALINQKQEFVGLLDNQRLLQYFLEQRAPYGPGSQEPQARPTLLEHPHRRNATLDWMASPQSRFTSEGIDSMTQSKSSEDSTADWQLQGLLTRVTQLVKENQKKDQILAYISHALKTPITRILSLSKLLLHPHQSPANLRQKQYLTLIHQGGKQLRMMIDDMVTWTQLELGEVTLKKLPVKSSQLGDRILSTFEELVQDLPQPPRLNFTPDPQIKEVMADEFWLGQMIHRLLSYNLWAIGDRLSDAQNYRSTPLQLELQSQGGFWISFRLTNPHLTTPINLTPWFSTSSHPNAFPSSPTWELGLVIVSQLAQLHGGDLMCTVTEKEGTEFTLLLPSQLLHQPSETEIESSVPQKLTLLCFSPGTPQKGTYQEWVRGCHTLKGQDCRLLEAEDLDQAEILARVWKPHVLVFNDAGLEDIQGHLNALRQSESLCYLPLITLSQETTQMANQIPGLLVFPCLVSPDSDLAVSTLLQVIKIAASQG